MKQINLESWPRRDYFRYFKDMTYPHFNLCANVDLTDFHPAIRQRNLSINVAIVYVLARAANDIPEFRFRIRGEGVVAHDIVHPSTTIMTDEDLFSFCPLEYSEDFFAFAPRAVQQIAYVREHRSIEDPPGKDDLLYLTAMPWVSFTSVVHPINLNPADSVPRIAWGKFFEDGDCLRMPLGLQAHHGLIDGIHVGRFYARVQDYLSDPDIFLDQA